MILGQKFRVLGFFPLIGIGLLVDFRNEKVVSLLCEHMDYSFASAMHPDGLRFAPGNKDKACRIWDIRNLPTSH